MSTENNEPTEAETELLRTVVNRVLGRSWSPALELDLLKAIRNHVAREKAKDAAAHAAQLAAKDAETATLRTQIDRAYEVNDAATAAGKLSGDIAATVGVLRLIIEETQMERDALAAQVAELRADKERLNWLESRQSTVLCHYPVAGWSIRKDRNNAEDEIADRNDHALRDAIDAARAQKGTT